MTSERLHVLIVEDNPADVDWIRAAPGDTGLSRFDSESVARLSEALLRLAAGGIDSVMTDLGLPDSQGLATFRTLRQAAPDVAMIVLTGSEDLEMAVAAVREGAQDYLVKGQISGDLLVRAVRYAIERKQVEDALRDSAGRFRRCQGLTMASSSAFPPFWGWAWAFPSAFPPVWGSADASTSAWPS